MVFGSICPALADDTIWQTLSTPSTSYEVHVVSNGSLGNGFPDRALSYDTDSGLITDLYVVDTATGQAVEIPLARNLVTLAQTAYKSPALRNVALSAQVAIPGADVREVSTPYPLLTSYYFSNFFVNSFVRDGITGGLDDASKRAELYALLLFDMAVQPDLADKPGDAARYQSVLDGALGVQEFVDLMGNEITALEVGNELDQIPWSKYKAAVRALSEKSNRFFELPKDTVDPTPLDKLTTVLDGIDDAAWLTGTVARTLLIETLAQERGQLRMAILQDFVARAKAAGSVDPALEQGVALAQQRLDAFTDEYFGKLFNIMWTAISEDAGGVLRLSKYSKYLVQAFFGKAAAATFASVAQPWILSFQTYLAIREQEDRARVASLAATLERQLFESYGLEHHRSAIDQGSSLNAEEIQAFAELYQMSWYLAARHYDDTYESLGNKISFIYGSGIDLFTGGSYSAQLEELSRLLERNRTVAWRIAPTTYLATYPVFSDFSPQEPEADWLIPLVGHDIPQGPTIRPEKLLGVCITLPFDPDGTPATLEGMHVRFEPRDCSDATGSQAWECGPDDPDGECTARVQLFWDDDRDPTNSDCSNRSGPCPIPGAEALNPRRGAFLWRAADDGLPRGSYYLFARIVDNDQSDESYSDGFYEFIDPIYEADHWSVVARTIEEGALADGDGIPEVGEQIEVTLYLQNTSGRVLQGPTIDNVRFRGEAARHLTRGDWDYSIPADRELSAVLQDESWTLDADPDEIVVAQKRLSIWVGQTSPTDIPLLAALEYWDRDNPTDPQYRRIQEIAFDVTVSDGSATPTFRCDHTDLVGDTDGDGVFESGERGSFTATLCNDGGWEGQQVRGVFESPPPIGRWSDDDAGYPDLNPTECQPSDDDFALRTEPSECGPLNLPMEVTFNGGSSQTGLSCPQTVTCVPFQSIQDDQDAGTVAAGDPAHASISITNIGAATLEITSISEVSGATDVSVDSFPATLAAGASGSIDITIDTTGHSPGRSSRTFRVESNANNTDEREAIVYFGVSDGAVAQQLTSLAVGSDGPDLSGDLAVFVRGGDVYVINGRTLEETRVTETGATETDPRIDGTRVVYERLTATGADVYLYDLDSSTETRITDLEARQSDADVFGDTIVWEDQRDGNTTADVYRYVIGQSSLNGEVLVNLGANVAAVDPRIEEDYVGYIIRSYSSQYSYNPDMGYLSRSDGALHSAGLLDNDPCNMGNRFDLFGNRVAFECDCGAACGDEDMIYTLNMATGSSPVRLTCDAGLDDAHEEPAIVGSDVLYEINRDLYRVSLAGSCQTEVPVEVGTQSTTDPAADPRTGAYVFLDDRTGSRQLWGVFPPPPVEAGITSLFFEDSELFQEAVHDYQVDVRNFGTEDLVNVAGTIEDGGVEIDSVVVTSLPAGQKATLQRSWSTGGAEAGEHTLTARLNPPPTGDADSADDQRSVVVELLDDDTTGPQISGVTVGPVSGGDGDPYIEDDEGVEVAWLATDQHGVGESHATLGSADYPGVSVGGDAYVATLPAQVAGEYQVTISAIDADDSPAATDPPTMRDFTVFPASPVVVSMNPADGATGIDPRTALAVTFSVEMDPGSVNSSTVKVSNDSSGVVPAGITYDAGNHQAVIQPSASLLPFTTYTLVVEGGATGVRDIRQNPLPATESSTFTTGETPQSCVDTLTLSAEVVSASKTYEACTEIRAGSDFRVESPATVELRAGQRVVLESGFSVGTGGGLRIVIDPTIQP